MKQKSKISVTPNGYRQKATHAVISCPCGYRHRYNISTSSQYLMDQCDLHDEICRASAHKEHAARLESNVPPATARRRERIAAAERGTQARAASNLRYETD